MVPPATPRRWLFPLLLVTSAAALPGCAALGLEAGSAGIAAIQGGAGAIVKAGTEYKANGTVYRTFSLQRDTVHDAFVTTLHRLDIGIQQDRESDTRATILGSVGGQKVEIRLEPLTHAMTRVRVIVKKSRFAKDGATASELLAQVEDTLGLRPGGGSVAARR